MGLFFVPLLLGLVELRLSNPPGELKRSSPRGRQECLLVRAQNEVLEPTRFPDQPASGKANSYIQSVLVRRTKGGHQMRRKLRAPEGAETLTYSFHFQISNN